MRLSRADKERITDSRMKLQSVANSLKQINPTRINDIDEIQDCLRDAEKSLKSALNADSP
jgi:hypothetical protein